MRDSERQKVYNAEARLHTYWVLIEEAKEIIDQLCDEFQVKMPTIVHNPRMRQYDGFYRSRDHSITFRSSEPSLKTVLHEFAHALTRTRHSRRVGRAHGGRFTEAMLDVVRYYLGVEQAANLRQHYLARGLATSAEEEDLWEDKVVARRRRDEERVGEKGPVYILSLKLKDGRVYFEGRTRYLTYEREWVKVWRREWAAYKAADSWDEGIAEVHKLNGIFDYPEDERLWGSPPRWMPVSEDHMDEIIERRRQS